MIQDGNYLSGNQPYILFFDRHSVKEGILMNTNTYLDYLINPCLFSNASCLNILSVI